MYLQIETIFAPRVMHFIPGPADFIFGVTAVTVGRVKRTP